MKPRENDPNHPYVRSLKGCGHGRLFTEPCIDCEIVSLIEKYKHAIRTVQSTRDRLRALGVKLPGNTSAAQQQEGHGEHRPEDGKVVDEPLAEEVLLPECGEITFSRSEGWTIAANQAKGDAS